MFGMPFGLILLGFAPWIIVLGGAFYLGLRLVRAVEHRAAARAEVVALTERMLLLEENLSAMGERLERVTEGQEVTTRLLAERK